MMMMRLRRMTMSLLSSYAGLLLAALFLAVLFWAALLLGGMIVIGRHDCYWAA